MEKGFRFSLVTGDATVYQGEVSYVNLPTAFGSVGILRGHAPMLCAVGKGVLRCTAEEGTLRFRVSDGVASVADGEVTVLAGAAEAIES